MLTNLRVRNFKRIAEAAIELGETVIFVGPNNSGKTAALQALALWELGIRRWSEKRSADKAPEKRPGVVINRRDLVSVPIPQAKLLWRNLHTRDVRRTNGKQKTANVLIEITVEGVTDGRSWFCGLEFDYSNEESFYVRPLRLGSSRRAGMMSVPPEAVAVRVSFLPPMSGLAEEELKLEPGGVNALLGRGQTAQVLRNLCFLVWERSRDDWAKLVTSIELLFGARMDEPEFVSERGEVTMQYEERGITLDLSSSGRGLQQTLLLLAHMYANPGTVLLLDEPDAHLEVLRQRETYNLITDVARELGSQIIAASHSEVVLNEAADRDVVIAFVGTPHRIDDRGSQLLKSLQEIPFDDYYQAETTGWVLYLEGATDLRILQAFARRLNHPAQHALSRPFVRYVGNSPDKVRQHFNGLREAMPDLRGVAVFDWLDEVNARRLPADLLGDPRIVTAQWTRRELENYLCMREVLLAYARGPEPGTLFDNPGDREAAMVTAVDEVDAAFRTINRQSPWADDVKASDRFLDPVFARYFELLELPNLMQKTDYHKLVDFVPLDLIAPEITGKLDLICDVAQSAAPPFP